jgi:hypothetical protein
MHRSACSSATHEIWGRSTSATAGELLASSKSTEADRAKVASVWMTVLRAAARQQPWKATIHGAPAPQKLGGEEGGH